MKITHKKVNILLSPDQKKKAKVNSFFTILNSFKTEGVTFSMEQEKKLRARLF